MARINLYTVYIGVGGYDRNMLVRASTVAGAIRLARKEVEMDIHVTPLSKMDPEDLEESGLNLAIKEMGKRKVYIYDEGT